jgi:Flp pilus assembly protein TadG
MSIRRVNSGRYRGCGEDGATAVEFALIAPIFMFVVMAVVEYSIFFFKVSHLKHVLYETSRTLQTGEIQKSADPASAFSAEYCSHVVVVRCADVYFDVRAYTSLGDVNPPEAVFGSDGVPTNFVFQPGGSGEISVLRVSTPHRFTTPLIAGVFGLGDEPAIIVGRSVAQNEPF